MGEYGIYHVYHVYVMISLFLTLWAVIFNMRCIAAIDLSVSLSVHIAL